MKSLSNVAILTIAVFTLLFIFSGCGPRPPVQYQPLTIQDSEEAEGYDVYLYISVDPDVTPQQIEELLKWLDSVKYPSVNKMAIFVWDNPQAALMGATGDLVGSLDVDRAAGKFEIRIPGLEQSGT